MFSGKTSSLKNEIKRFNIAGYKAVAFKPSIDTRYKKNEIVTHDMTSIECIMVDDINQLMNYCNKLNPHVVAIDEIQFLGGSVQKIISCINELLAKNITVVVAGLDIDYTGTPFEVVKELMPIADYLYKHHAVCVKCGSDAWVSHRKSKDKDRIKIGAEDEYEPLCRKCFLEVKNMENED